MSSEWMPSRWATEITASGVTFMTSRAATVLSERASALVSVTGPIYFCAVVLRLPVADPDRRVEFRRGGAEALLERGKIDEGLEGRAGLALGFRRAVELALRIGLAADHRLDGAAGIEHHQCALRSAELGAFLVQAIAQRLFGVRLRLAVDGRPHDDRFVKLA